MKKYSLAISLILLSTSFSIYGAAEQEPIPEFRPAAYQAAIANLDFPLNEAKKIRKSIKRDPLEKNAERASRILWWIQQHEVEIPEMPEDLEYVLTQLYDAAEKFRKSGDIKTAQEKLLNFTDYYIENRPVPLYANIQMLPALQNEDLQSFVNQLKEDIHDFNFKKLNLLRNLPKQLTPDQTQDNQNLLDITLKEIDKILYQLENRLGNLIKLDLKQLKSTRDSISKSNEAGDIRQALSDVVAFGLDVEDLIAFLEIAVILPDAKIIKFTRSDNSTIADLLKQLSSSVKIDAAQLKLIAAPNQILLESDKVKPYAGKSLYLWKLSWQDEQNFKDLQRNQIELQRLKSSADPALDNQIKQVQQVIQNLTIRLQTSSKEYIENMHKIIAGEMKNGRDIANLKVRRIKKK